MKVLYLKSFNTTMATINYKRDVYESLILKKFQYHNGYD